MNVSSTPVPSIMTMKSWSFRNDQFSSSKLRKFLFESIGRTYGAGELSSSAAQQLSSSAVRQLGRFIYPLEAGGGASRKEAMREHRAHPTQTVQRLGKVLATLAACTFAYMAYQAMKANERTHHTHNAGHAPPDLAVAGSGWFLRLCVVGLVAMVGGVMSRGPVKPINLWEAPPITGVVPSYTDFLQASSTRARLLERLLGAAEL
jgi:hypothetical protein